MIRRLREADHCDVVGIIAGSLAAIIIGPLIEVARIRPVIDVAGGVAVGDP